ncbi:putative zinc binding dehydrogenase [Naematelia encephala]|uniref:Putative zinc binding dehydrogenase n=1 Tax=Naematelia encephala TaxID=71784 RepID=A0A1Y2ARH0_9TREE|nr:putative zinc binding dehydrogenase [Naematelia encephala]
MSRENLAAVLQEVGTALKPLLLSIPSQGENEILVRNHAIAANPADWKLRDFPSHLNKFPTVLGSDVCGIVSAIGSKVSKFKVGDRVAGFALVIANMKPEHGAWQTYTLLQENATIKIPDFMSYEAGATFPMAFATVAVAYFERLGIARPVSSSQEVQQQRQSGILVWGASSSTGTAAVQLAKELGFKVFATASPKNHEYVKSLGASEVVDYRDPDAVSKLAQLAKDAGTPLRYGFDSISEGNSSLLSAGTLLASGGEGSKLVLTSPWPTGDEKPAVEISMTMAAFAFVYHAEMGGWMFNEFLPQALEQRKIVPAPKVRVVDGGIAAAQEALELVKAGVSATKIVVRVD